MKNITLLFCALLVKSPGDHLQSDKTIQFDIGPILNARPVTVLYGNKLVSWRRGIDGDGLADGYLTLGAALFKGDKNPHALPDNGSFAANAFRPKVILHYAGTDTLSNQACAITGAGSVGFSVRAKRYSAVYLALTSAEGPSLLHIKLFYTDGAAEKDFLVPDYYQDVPPGDPNLSYLAHDLAKWGNKNNMTEKDHHNIDLLNIHPDPGKKLYSISITKSKPGYLVIWAATGVKSS